MSLPLPANDPGRCPYCDGTGLDWLSETIAVVEKSKLNSCSRCNGTGRIREPIRIRTTVNGLVEAERMMSRILTALDKMLDQKLPNKLRAQLINIRHNLKWADDKLTGYEPGA